jgi:hypothetical protein
LEHFLDSMVGKEGGKVVEQIGFEHWIWKYNLNNHTLQMDETLYGYNN